MMNLLESVEKSFFWPHGTGERTSDRGRRSGSRLIFSAEDFVLGHGPEAHLEKAGKDMGNGLDRSPHPCGGSMLLVNLFVDAMHFASRCR